MLRAATYLRVDTHSYGTRGVRRAAEGARPAGTARLGATESDTKLDNVCARALHCNIVDGSKSFVLNQVNQ